MLKRNIISNFLGGSYVVILQFVLVPIYLKYLGAEAYGLIGIYFTLLAAVNMLDLGLSPALSRELARLTALPNSTYLMRSTVTTLECIYLLITFLIVVTFYFGSPLIAKYWLNNNSLPIETINTCLQLMGLQCAFQLLTNYYNNGLAGLQHMVRANSVLVLNHTLRAISGLFVLTMLPANVQIFFISQAIVTFVGLLITAYSLYVVLPSITIDKEKKYYLFARVRFSIERFNATKRFAAGMAITSVCSFLIMQTDKIILSKLLTLEQFGYYTVAINIAVTISGAASLISKSVLPRMTQLVASNEIDALKNLYIKSTSIIAWLILPIAGLLIIFSHQFLMLYLGDVEKTVYLAPVFSLLMFGYAVHSLMYVPYALSLAYGWTRYGVSISIISILVMTPVTIFATLQFGVMGAAASWMALSIGYLCFALRYLHQKIYRDLYVRFYKTTKLQLLILAISLIGYFLVN